MDTPNDCFQDVMRVCRAGHVLTNLLWTLPERRLCHCDGCGTVTLNRCLPRGQALPAPVSSQAKSLRPRNPRSTSSGAGA
jgi:hypothetical protein